MPMPEELYLVRHGESEGSLVNRRSRAGDDSLFTPGSGSTPSNRVEIGAGGLPIVRCTPVAPAARQSIEELLALEQSTLAGEDRERAGLYL